MATQSAEYYADSEAVEKKIKKVAPDNKQCGKKEFSASNFLLHPRLCISSWGPCTGFQ
jgi:hypothetical protein